MTESETLKLKIKDMLKRVPDSVNNGSYQHAVQYKKHACAALREV